MAIWMAAVQALGKANQAKAQARIDTVNLKTQAKLAELEGNLYSMNLQKNFNKALASDAVMGFAQMRRGGSVTAMSDAATSQFNWDMDFADLSTEIKTKGLEFDIGAAKRAGDTAYSSALASGAVNMYTDYSKAQENKSLLAPAEDV